MLASDVDPNAAIEGLGEPGPAGDAWGGLDNLELEDLYPAKNKR
jgi:hypothetical protein